MYNYYFEWQLQISILTVFRGTVSEFSLKYWMKVKEERKRDTKF